MSGSNLTYYILHLYPSIFHSRTFSRPKISYRMYTEKDFLTLIVDELQHDDDWPSDVQYRPTSRSHALRHLLLYCCYFSDEIFMRFAEQICRRNQWLKWKIRVVHSPLKRRSEDLSLCRRLKTLGLLIYAPHPNCLTLQLSLTGTFLGVDCLNRK